MELFKVENHILVIDNEIVRGIPEFEVLITRDKSKKVYLNEFKYIYLMNNYKSPFIDLPDRERKERVIKNCGLAKDWKVDSDIANAENKYNELQNLPASFNVINNLNKSLNLSSRVIAALNNQMEQLINTSTKANPDNIQGDILAIKPMMDEILETANKLPKVLSNIEIATDKFKKDISIENERRGGGRKGNREQADYQSKIKSNEEQD